ncbi:MAG: hypothetical protein N3F05_04690 [Candidatus Diapherotrites archaeon]|nr:hypothetical protein [Candidatus Diapherotrites archaeon]
MLEDFIEINKLKATIINKPIISPNSAKCILYLRDNAALKPALAILMRKDRIDFEKFSSLFPSSELREASAKEAFNVTGYKKGFIPPISVYGVIVVLDSKAAKMGFLHMLVSELTTLEVSVDEIKEMNEDFMICDITR